MSHTRGLPGLPARVLVAALVYGLVPAQRAMAQGCIIIPPPHPIPPPVPVRQVLRLKSLAVSIRIEDGIARTTADQVFMNDQPYSVEATYLFPLPEDSVVSDFALFVNGKQMAGEVLDKDKARAIYEDIVRKLRDPGLLEYMGRGLFKVSMFPVPANSEQKVRLEYGQHLPSDNGMYCYRYPLPRSGNSMSSNLGAPESIAISGSLQSRSPIKTIYSPTHEIDTSDRGDRAARFSYEVPPPKGGPSAAGDRRDFMLYYGVSDRDFGVHLACLKKEGDDGYFLLTLSPKREWQVDEVAAKDIIFVLDTSGSMAGEKIEQAKRVLKFCLENLNRNDRFNIVTFSTEVRTLWDEIMPVDRENIRQAQGFVDEIKARGGTDIHGALTRALQMTKADDRSPMIIFVTDGLPTVGETDEATIVNAINQANGIKPSLAVSAIESKPIARLFAFGVGYDVNTHLLDRLAEDNRGVSEYVKPDEDMEVKISNFYEKVSYPVLSDLEIDWGKLKVFDVYPRFLPDLFKGSQVTVLGRYRNGTQTSLELTGYVKGKKQRFEYDLATPDKEKGDDIIARLWASRKIGFLLSEIRLRGENKELKDEVVRLSLEFGILTPYTSMLVQEDEKRDRVVAQHVYSGGIGGPAGPAGPAGSAGPARAAFEAKSGADSVSVSGSLNGLRRTEVVGLLPPSVSAQTTTVRRVGTKTFYLINNVWTDSLLKTGQETLKVKYLSAAYFALAQKSADLAKCFSVGEKVIVCLPGGIIEVSDTGRDNLKPEELSRILAKYTR